MTESGLQRWRFSRASDEQFLVPFSTNLLRVHANKFRTKFASEVVNRARSPLAISNFFDARLSYFLLSLFLFACLSLCTVVLEQEHQVPEQSWVSFVTSIFELGLKHSSPKVR